MSTTAPDLAAIEARLAAATPGPWHVEHRGVVADDGTQVVDDCVCAGWDVYPDNAHMIAHAPDDLRALVARVRAADADLTSATATMERAAADLCALTARVRELEAALSASRGEWRGWTDVDP